MSVSLSLLYAQFVALVIDTVGGFVDLLSQVLVQITDYPPLLCLSLLLCVFGLIRVVRRLVRYLYVDERSRAEEKSTGKE